MIKRIIACLTICLIITGLVSPVFSHAEPIPIYTPNWNDPGIAEIINISDLTGWMANGGVYDITSFQNLDEFLTWYFKIRVPVQDEDGNITFAPTYGYDTYLDSNYSSPRFIEQSNIRGMIGRSYQNKTGYGRRLQEQVDKALLEDGDLYNVNIPLLNTSEASSFIGYSTNAIDFYRNIFNIGDNIPDPNPDPNYYNYLDTINGSDFYFKNYPITVGGSGYYQSAYNFPFSSYSYFSINMNSYNVLEPIGETYLAKNFYQSNIITININSISNNNYTYSVNLSSLYPACKNDWNNQPWAYFTFRTDTNSWSGGTTNGKDFSVSASSQYTGSLNNVLSHIADRFRNVTIYVDDELWAFAGIVPDPVVPEFPDVVGGDELPTTTWPLTVPKAPSYINLPGLRQAFQRAKNTDNQFDIMDLKDSLVDPEGDPIVDPEMETVPIPLPNPDPINPDVVPELPDLPLIPPANNPGFSGVSVLAEIINFTNQSLPSGLITVFWGIVFGAVILGIIKILHK